MSKPRSRKYESKLIEVKTRPLVNNAAIDDNKDTPVDMDIDIDNERTTMSNKQKRYKTYDLSVSGIQL